MGKLGRGTAIVLFSSIIGAFPAGATTQGPLQDPISVHFSYARSDQTSLYVQFSAGAMPGCYQDRGGRMYSSDPQFEPLYAQLLLVMANPAGFRGHVIYDIENTDPNFQEWDKCKFKGLYLYPE